MNFTKPIGPSIAAKLLLVTAGLSLVLTFLLSSVEIWQEAKIMALNEQSEARAVVMVNIDTLGSTVWNYDRATMATIARSLTHGTSIFRVKIMEEGARAFSYSRPGGTIEADYNWTVPLVRPGTNQNIGTLTVWETYQDVQSAMKQRALPLVIAELVKVLTTSALLFVVAYLLVARPLRQVARKVQRVEEGGDDLQISVRRAFRWGHDEIDALVDAINVSNLARQRMVAQQREDQQREANAGKLKALGQLAGGIAHDFNNILGAILGFAALLEEDLAQDKEKQQFTHKIMSAARRGRDFISQIWTFAHAERPDQTVVDLVQIVRQSLLLLEPLLPKNINVLANYGDRQFPILADATLVGQMVTNLCLNASEAFESRVGTISVSLSRSELAELEALTARPPGADERLVGEFGRLNELVCLRISDAAGFIPKDDMGRIFEPFFSTKGRRIGAGLGLAVVHSVVASHGGVCHIMSREGEGTIFSIYFPLSRLALGEMEPISSDLMPHGSERVMIVDDEQDIVDVLSLGLERLGYKTVGIDNPILALEAFETDPDAWDVLVTDEMMPEMRGSELVSNIKKIRPEIKVVVYTGFGEELTGAAENSDGADVFLLKPVTAKDLARQIRLLMQAHHLAD